MQKQYLQQLKDVRKRARSINRFASADLMNAYTFYSANLTHFLPCIQPAAHLKLFRQTYQHLWMSHMDQAYFGGDFPIAIQGWDQSLADKLRERPGIISTLHTGSYRLVNYLLAQAGIPYALLVSSRVMQEQAPEIRAVLERLSPGNPIPLIEAEQPSAALSILRTLRKGTNILAYLDGFEGTALADRGKLSRVSFLGQHLWVRKGIPYLSHRAGVPLYPVLNFRNDDGSIQVFHGQTLEPGGFSSDRYIDRSLQYQFDFLGALLIHYPEQWEGWLSLHEHVSPAHCHRRAGSLRKRFYGLLRLNDRRYLMNKRTYELTPIRP